MSFRTGQLEPRHRRGAMRMYGELTRWALRLCDDCGVVLGDKDLSATICYGCYLERQRRFPITVKGDTL